MKKKVFFVVVVFLLGGSVVGMKMREPDYEFILEQLAEEKVRTVEERGIAKAFTQMRTLKVFAIGVLNTLPSYEKAKKWQCEVKKFNLAKKTFYEDLISTIKKREILSLFSSEDLRRETACMIEDHLRYC